MSKALAHLLSNDHPLFTFNVDQLEKASGGDNSVTSRLIGDMVELSHTFMRRLQLDPQDTSARELYQSLLEASKRPDASSLFRDMHYTLINVEGEVISFNLFDVVESAHHELPFESRLSGHAKRRLRLEIIKRFAEHDRGNNVLIKQLTREADIHIEEDKDHQVADTLLLESGTKNEHVPSLLAIGDIFTDAFIKLDESYAVIEKDENGAEWLKLPFGSKPPYETVDVIKSVGPSPNAAVSASRLGLNVSLMAWLGFDEAGRQSIAHLQSENVNTSNMIIEPDMISSYWYVLRHGSERTMLVKSEDYHYDWKEPVSTPDWIYLAYIGKNSVKFHEDLLTYLEKNDSIKFVFQPATYHFEWGVEKLRGLYKRAHMVVMNREEAMQVTGKPHDDMKALMSGLHALGSEIVVITDGSHGSYASQNNEIVTVPNYPDPAPPLDRTGAGDAFASTITAGLALGKTLKESLLLAPINSASVVQKLGAQEGLLSFQDITSWLEKAPRDYKVSEIKD